MKTAERMYYQIVTIKDCAKPCFKNECTLGNHSSNHVFYLNRVLFLYFSEAEEIRLDRWTVVFRPQSEESEGADGRVTAASAQV